MRCKAFQQVGVDSPNLMFFYFIFIRRLGSSASLILICCLCYSALAVKLEPAPLNVHKSMRALPTLLDTVRHQAGLLLWR